MKNRTSGFYTYPEAQAVVKRLGVTSLAIYRELHIRDPLLPARPDIAYLKSGWVDWFDFLGKRRTKLYSTYEQARAAVRRIGPPNRARYKDARREDPRLPSHPHLAYANLGWAGWHDYLGLPELYASYEEAKSATRELNIKSQVHYAMLRKADERLPRQPHVHYADMGWTDWHDFLGTVKADRYADYAEASRAAQSLKISNGSDYAKRFHEDPKLPRHPSVAYAHKGWTNWYEFLGRIKPDCYPRYSQARAATRALGIKNWSEYMELHKKDPRLPTQPQVVYARTGWKDWYVFLGNRKPEFYSEYALASDAAQRLGISTSIEYGQRYQEDPNLPSSPATVYKGAGWMDWYEFLGHAKPEFYRTYKQARAAARSLEIASSSDYKRRYKEDPKLPSWPNVAYATDGWVGWSGFLGSVTDPSTTHAKTWDLVKHWLQHQDDPALKKRVLKSVVQGFLKRNELPDDPLRFARRIRSGCELYDQFLKTQPRPRQAVLKKVVGEFSSWLIFSHGISLITGGLGAGEGLLHTG